MQAGAGAGTPWAEPAWVSTGLLLLEAEQRLEVDGLADDQDLGGDGLTVKTVQAHRANIMEKLGTHDRTGLVMGASTWASSAPSRRQDEEARGISVAPLSSGFS
jgi:hypothetical protein